jgi:hypothetical protein
LAGSLSDIILIGVMKISGRLLTGRPFRSNEYMSTSFSASLPRRTAFQRQVWDEFFGDMIRSAREDKGRSIEEAAPRAGMTVAEWEAMEEGLVPGTREQLVAIAEALEADLDAIVALAILCRLAWSR